MGSGPMVMKVEAVGNLGTMGILSWIRAGFKTSICGLVLVVEVLVVLSVVLVWMILTVWVVVGVMVEVVHSDGEGSVDRSRLWVK